MTFNLFGEEGINWMLVAALIGAFPLARWLLIVAYEFVKQLIPTTDLLKRYCRTDVETWAVVTGATDGIGLGFC